MPQTSYLTEEERQMLKEARDAALWTKQSWESYGRPKVEDLDRRVTRAEGAVALGLVILPIVAGVVVAYFIG